MNIIARLEYELESVTLTITPLGHPLEVVQSNEYKSRAVGVTSEVGLTIDRDPSVLFISLYYKGGHKAPRVLCGRGNGAVMS